MAELTFNAEVRTTTGKNVTHRLRAAGNVPAVIYGKGIDPIHCSLNLKEVENALKKVNRNSIIQIAFGGKEKDREVILRDKQLNPLTRRFDHIDFQAVDFTHPIRVDVDIKLNGDPIGRKTGAILTVQTKALRIECLPSKIPPCVEVDVSALDAGDSLHVSDIPKGEFKIISNPKLTICQMSVIKEEVVEAAPAAVAAVEGAAAPVAGTAPAAGAAPAAPAEEKKEAKR